MVLYVLAGLGLVAALAAGCGKSGGGMAEIPEGMKVTSLGDVLARPAEWNGRKVLLEGTVAWMCPSLCEFTLADGKVSADVYPRDFQLEKYKKGQKVRVYAEIVAGEERTVISGLAVEKR